MIAARARASAPSRVPWRAAWRAARIATLLLAAVGAGHASAGCGDSGERAAAGGEGPRARSETPVLRVAAAASLTEVITRLAEEHERARDVEVEVRLGATSTLARQIEAGAPTDVLVSADPRWVDALAEAGLVAGGARRAVATNRLVAIVPEDAPVVPRDVRALAALPHLAVAGAEVPAGRYARDALERGGVLEEARPHLVEGADVRATLAWVARGEAEGGIVYATDARIEPRVRVAFELPAETCDPIVLEAARVTSERGEIASEFMDFLRSDRARAIFAEAGFGPPP